jgi:dienelactone hydrolase
MKAKYIITVIFIFSAMITGTTIVHAENPPPGTREEVLNYSSGGVACTGFVAYDGKKPGKRAVIVVIPEWWGLNDYTRMRARKLAELGYLAVVLDMFGGGKNASVPAEAQQLTAPFYKDPLQGRSVYDAALKEIKKLPLADTGNIAAIGYCFGGFIALNIAKSGADLKGVVSFHGGLGGTPADRERLNARILVCNGASDQFISQEEISDFKHQMDSIGADYTFKSYAGATHSFTNPDATNLGRKFNLPIEYSATADKDSWNDMTVFFKQIFK